MVESALAEISLENQDIDMTSRDNALPVSNNTFEHIFNLPVHPNNTNLSNPDFNFAGNKTGRPSFEGSEAAWARMMPPRENLNDDETIANRRRIAPRRRLQQQINTATQEAPQIEESNEPHAEQHQASLITPAQIEPSQEADEAANEQSAETSLESTPAQLEEESAAHPQQLQEESLENPTETEAETQQPCEQTQEQTDLLGPDLELLEVLWGSNQEDSDGQSQPTESQEQALQNQTDTLVQQPEPQTHTSDLASKLQAACHEQDKLADQQTEQRSENNIEQPQPQQQPYHPSSADEAADPRTQPLTSSAAQAEEELDAAFEEAFEKFESTQNMDRDEDDDDHLDDANTIATRRKLKPKSRVRPPTQLSSQAEAGPSTTRNPQRAQAVTVTSSSEKAAYLASVCCHGWIAVL